MRPRLLCSRQPGGAYKTLRSPLLAARISIDISLPRYQHQLCYQQLHLSGFNPVVVGYSKQHSSSLHYPTRLTHTRRLSTSSSRAKMASQQGDTPPSIIVPFFPLSSALLCSALLCRVISYHLSVHCPSPSYSMFPPPPYRYPPSHHLPCHLNTPHHPQQPLALALPNEMKTHTYPKPLDEIKQNYIHHHLPNPTIKPR